ncbi:hypothetical protein EFY79_05070 [Hanamia caeni]|uniref:Uncharacterized protein n=1 Tax=Hanamia caeni TaxID=2294116 RepID=A0A3M9NMK8_9BACT|nr:hypothetical protein EFY79_05070 [Hanamia caeni]
MIKELSGLSRHIFKTFKLIFISHQAALINILHQFVNCASGIDSKAINLIVSCFGNTLDKF